MTEEMVLDAPALPKQVIPKYLKGQKALVTGANSGIGKAAAFLASDQADYITGASLYVDGGMTLYPGFATGG